MPDGHRVGVVFEQIEYSVLLEYRAVEMPGQGCRWLCRPRRRLRFEVAAAVILPSTNSPSKARGPITISESTLPAELLSGRSAIPAVAGPSQGTTSVGVLDRGVGNVPGQDNDRGATRILLCCVGYLN